MGKEDVGKQSQEKWKGSQVFVASIDMEKREEIFFGGVCIVVGPRIASYVQKVENNPLD